ncbi:MAG: MBL fold metallo-hydrolase [Spirochaetales bacterium]|nr:MBL fold metallo-hydrolase [Spirochaetales bacterium]
MEMTKTIHAIKHNFIVPVNPELKLERIVYSFIIFGKLGVYLIDSGVAGSGDRIINYISERGYRPSQIKALVLTHGHPDHIGAAAHIVKKTGCKVLAHKSEIPWIENIDRQLNERPVPGFKNLVNQSVKVDKVIEHNQRIQLEDNFVLRVVHTPGHSQGSLSLFMEDQKALFVGDALLLPGNLPIYDNPFEAQDSIRELQNIKNPRFLFSAWDEAAAGEEIQAKFEQSLAYFQEIHKHVLNTDKTGEMNEMELCQKVITAMGLPVEAVNSLVAKSLKSHFIENHHSLALGA